MVITTLGTSHGYNTYGNYYASTLFEAESGSYLVDAGCQAETRMIHLGRDISKIKAIFITHPHHDHMGGIIGILKDIRRTSGGTANIDVYLPDDIGEDIKTWANAIFTDLSYVNFIPFDAGTIYDNGSFRVEAIPTNHLKRGDKVVSYSFAIETEGKSILCSGDVTREFEDFPRICLEKEFDLCICESVHYLPEKAAELFEKAKIKRYIFNHIGDKWRGPRAGREFLEYFKNVKAEKEFAVDGQSFII